MRRFFPLLFAISVLGCSDDEPLTFRSKQPFDAVVVDGTTASAYGLRVAGEERIRICSSCSVLARSPAGDHALLQQGDTEFFIAEPGRVNEVLDLAGAATDGAPAELPSSLQASWSPDSKHLALLWGTSQAYVAAADGTGIAPIATGAFDPTGSDAPSIVWSPDSSHVSFGLADGVLAITDAKGSSTLTLPEGSTEHHWSPDGGLFAFTNAGVSVVDTATLETRVVSETATQSVGWSPDGEWFAYVDDGLVLAPADASEPVVVPLDTLSTAAWSPVADELVYGGDLMRDGSVVDVLLGLWSPDRSLSIPVDAEASKLVPRQATWSPDGARFFWRLPSAERSANYALTDATDGNELAMLPGDYDAAPRFNRDGSALALTRTTVEGTELSVVDASGNDVVTIASHVEHWQWLDDGAHLLLVTGGAVVIASADGKELSTRLSVSDGAQIDLVP